jgi:hypothetical protein
MVGRMAGLLAESLVDSMVDSWAGMLAVERVALRAVCLVD